MTELRLSNKTLPEDWLTFRISAWECNSIKFWFFPASTIMIYLLEDANYLTVLIFSFKNFQQRETQRHTLVEHLETVDVRTWMMNLASSALLSWWMGTTDKSIQMRTFWKVGQWWKTVIFFLFCLVVPDCTVLLHFWLCLAFMYSFLCCCWSVSLGGGGCWFLKKYSSWQFWG